MAVHFARKTLPFDGTAGTHPQTLAGQTVTFTHLGNKSIKRADAAIASFKLEFKGDDHNFYIGRATVDAVDVVSADTVKFDGHINLQDLDASNPFKGEMTVLVIADAE